jgi:hypothetical protein
VQGTVKEAAGLLASEFRRHDRPSPCHDPHSPNKWHPRLLKIFQAWKNMDPPTKRQPVIPPKHLRYPRRIAVSKRDFALADLAEGAWFFACCRCEYLTVYGERKTKILCLRIVVFLTRYLDQVDHSDPDLAAKAYYVAVTFEDQKNGHKKEMRSQERSGDN